MKRLLFISLLMCACIAGAQAQNVQLDGLMSAFSGKCVAFGYSITMEESVPVSYEGNAVVQQNCFKAEGAGLQFYSDGESMWTVDSSAMEVYIESADEVESFFGRIPYILAHMKDFKAGENGFSGSISDPDSGLNARFSVMNITVDEPLDDLSGFVFDCSSLGGNWVVTDLR